jgi:hypothetical protein
VPAAAAACAGAGGVVAGSRTTASPRSTRGLGGRSPRGEVRAAPGGRGGRGGGACAWDCAGCPRRRRRRSAVKFGTARVPASVATPSATREHTLKEFGDLSSAATPSAAPRGSRRWASPPRRATRHPPAGPGHPLRRLNPQGWRR